MVSSAYLQSADLYLLEGDLRPYLGLSQSLNGYMREPGG